MLEATLDIQLVDATVILETRHRAHDFLIVFVVGVREDCLVLEGARNNLEDPSFPKSSSNCLVHFSEPSNSFSLPFFLVLLISEAALNLAFGCTELLSVCRLLMCEHSAVKDVGSEMLSNHSRSRRRRNFTVTSFIANCDPDVVVNVSPCLNRNTGKLVTFGT